MPTRTLSGQTMLPVFDLDWLVDTANDLAEAREMMRFYRKLADKDDMADLIAALNTAHASVLAAEKIAAQRARALGIARGLVGDVERDGQRTMVPCADREDLT